MRGSTRLGLAAAVLLVILCGAYSAYWFVAAGQIKGAVEQWARSPRAQDLNLSWREIRVSGFPLAFRVELSDATLHSPARTADAELRLPLLSGSTKPWSPRLWQLAAPRGLSATAGLFAGGVATLSARAASGSVAVADDGGATLWLGLTEPTADAGLRVAARAAELWLSVPARPPQTHEEPALGIALDVRALSLPVVPAPLQNPLDEIALGLTLKGAVPAAPPRQAAATWSDAGGTLELDHLSMRWGAVEVTGAGTLALDPDLQPIGSFSAAIEGYGELMNALVAAGRLRAGDARLAGFALGMLAKAGPDGRPQIATSFTIQDGQMFLGPAKLGKLPRIGWN